MYMYVCKEMEDADITEKLDKPRWQIQTGEGCTDNEAFGCKVTHRPLYPEVSFVMDEVGSNSRQKGDGHIGGKLIVCT